MNIDTNIPGYYRFQRHVVHVVLDAMYTHIMLNECVSSAHIMLNECVSGCKQIRTRIICSAATFSV